MVMILSIIMGITASDPEARVQAGYDPIVWLGLVGRGRTVTAAARPAITVTVGPGCHHGPSLAPIWNLKPDPLDNFCQGVL